MMKRLNEILSEIGISKVKLAKYLGVSRQMVYNYLEMDDVNEWPLEKKMKLFNLLQIKSSSEIENIKITNEFIKHANNLINDNNAGIIEKGSISFEGINSKDQALKELGYAELNESNYSEVLEKIAEIQSRKI